MVESSDVRFLPAWPEGPPETPADPPAPSCETIWLAAAESVLPNSVADTASLARLLSSSEPVPSASSPTAPLSMPEIAMFQSIESRRSADMAT